MAQPYTGTRPKKQNLACDIWPALDAFSREGMAAGIWCRSLFHLFPHTTVMAGLDPAIHGVPYVQTSDVGRRRNRVDARIKSGHDD
jgi:hypothetical protein